MKKILGFLLLAIVVAGAAAGGMRGGCIRCLSPSPGEPRIRRSLGSSLSAVARELGNAGVLPQPMALVALARYRGADRGIKAGSYEIESGITLPQLLAKLTQGDVTQTSVVIVEGSTFADMRRLLRTNAR